MRTKDYKEHESQNYHHSKEENCSKDQGLQA